MSKWAVGMVVGVLSWLFAPTLVAAQQIGATPDATGALDPADAGIRRQSGPGTGMGLALSLGGGVTNFVQQDANDVAGLGGSWLVRAGLGTRSLAGFEITYTGSAHDVGGEGYSPDAYFVRNGVEGAVRLNAPLVGERWMFSPFATLGVGWMRYDLMNQDSGAFAVDVQESDNVLVVPLGAGVAAAFSGFIVDARVTFRPSFDDSFLGGETELDAWTAGASIGREF